ncbi:MAG: PD-(D/E)XK nuclease family transposase, partial [Treponema sp.]|nr:PD-(D/E)XK nuclease family transposase [Treponema sp.]
QAFNQEYDYGKRAEYQVSRLEATYLKRGESWEKAPVVYQISILNFLYDFKGSGKGKEEKRPSPVSRFAMRTRDGKCLSNTLNIVFVELPKVYALEESLETNTALENWAIFLKDADNPEKRDIIDKLTCKEKGLMEAQKSLSSVSTDMDLWWAEYRQEIYERDRISSIEAATKKGLAKGYEEGISKGLKEKAISLAKKYMAMGHSAKEAAEFAEIDESLLV